MQHTAILFDMNGVLVDDEPYHEAAFRDVLRQYDIDLDEQAYQTYFAGKTDIEAFVQFFQVQNTPLPKPIERLEAEKVDAYKRHAAQGLTAYDGAISLVRRLKERGITLALVTSANKPEAEVVFRALDLENVFTAVVTAQDVDHGKPDAEPYQKAAEAIGYDPHQCIVIEDSPSGVKAAKSAGARCIAIASTHQREELAEADTIIEKIADITLDMVT